MPGGRRTRPRGRPYTFACRVCQITLSDGVDYTWCPRCNHEVDWIDGRFPVSTCPPCDLLINKRVASTDHSCPNCAMPLVAISSPLPTEAHTPPSPLRSMMRWSGIALLVVQALFAVLDPDAFGYLAPLLVFAQLCSFLIVGWFLVSSNELRDIAAYHQTRVIHGLEHATAKVLEERGLVVQRGLTTHGMFTLEIEHDGTPHEQHFETTVRDAATDAISRIRFGEHALAHDRRCGTSVLVGTTLLATTIAGIGLAAVILGWPVGYTFAFTVAGAFAARALARPAGLAAQRWLTVSTDFASAIVTRVDKRVSSDGNTLTAIVMIDVIPRLRDVDAVAPVQM